MARRGRCRGHVGVSLFLARLVWIALTFGSRADAQVTSERFAFLSPSPCVFRLDALDAKVTALADGGVSAMGARTPFVASDAVGGFFGAAFQGMGRGNDQVSAQGDGAGERTSGENSAASADLFGVTASGDRSAALGDGSIAEGDFSLERTKTALHRKRQA